MPIVISLVAGLLFGLGLIIAGMGNPAKVLAFLDLSGNWDPSLAFVMGGAIPVSAVAFWLAKRQPASLLGHAIQLPNTRNLDKRLVIGGALFGIGWGLAGICPGPALVLLGSGVGKVLVFIVAMLAGMVLFSRFDQRVQRK